MEFKLGVIGYGDAGTDFLKAAACVDGWTAAGVGGRNMEKAAGIAEEHGTPAMTVNDMLADPDINVIAVTTPPGSRMDECVNVLEAGKHLICEKPMAVSVPDCDRLMELADKNALSLMLAHSTSFFPAAIKARELIEKGAIGTLISVEEELQYNYFGAKRVGWQVVPALSAGGVVMNPCTHMVNRIRLLAGSEVTAVNARVGYNNPDHPEIEGDVNALLQMGNRVRGIVSLNGYGPNRKFFACTAKGTKGAIYMDGWNAGTCYLHRSGEKEPEPHEGRQPQTNGMPVNISYALKLEIWKEDIEAGRTPFSDGYNGRQNIAACQAIHRSSRTGETVEPE